MTPDPKTLDSARDVAQASLAPATGSAFEVVAIKFRDISDVINLRRQSRTFQTRFFTPGDKQDEESAMNELWASAQKHGLTKKEVIKVVRCVVEMPNDPSSPTQSATAYCRRHNESAQPRGPKT